MIGSIITNSERNAKIVGRTSRAVEDISAKIFGMRNGGKWVNKNSGGWVTANTTSPFYKNNKEWYNINSDKDDWHS